MEYFEGAKAVKLKSVHHAKCLWADDDRHSVAQKREKEGKQDMTIIWKVEHVPERNTIRLKSRYDLYLMASDYHFLLGATGKKVMQSFASKADSSCEWEPISDGEFVKLKTKNETFLRANGGLPPWRNSVTHDVPVLANTRDSIFWDVEIVERRVQEPHVISQRLQAQPVAQPQPPPSPPPQEESSDEDVDSPPVQSYLARPHLRRQGRTSPPEGPSRESSMNSDGSSSPSLSHSAGRHRSFDVDGHDSDSKLLAKKPQHPTPRAIVRRIFYSVAEDDGEVLAHEDMDWGSFLYKGHSLKDLIEQVQLETGIEDDIILCMRHPLSNKLYKMRLELPPNKAPMHVVVVRAESQLKLGEHLYLQDVIDHHDLRIDLTCPNCFICCARGMGHT